MQTYLILLRIGRWLLVRAQLSWLVFNWSKESVKGRHVTNMAKVLYDLYFNTE